jgi:tripartite ATP-independent transporter DctP family solute receptor
MMITPKDDEIRFFNYKHRGGIAMKKTYLLTIVFALIVLIVPAVAFSGAIKLHVGHIAPPVDGLNNGAHHFKNVVEMMSGGRIKASVHPAGQLGGEIAMAEAVQTGTLEMGFIGDAPLANMIPQMALCGLPFFYPDKAALERVWSGSVGEKIASLFPQKGLVLLTWTSTGFRDFGNSKHPIHTPADIGSLKMRTLESPLFIDSYKALGVNPVPTPWPEVFSSLQQGVVDGIDLPYRAMWTSKVYEALKHVTLCGWTYTGSFAVINKKFYDSLPRDLREIVKDAAYEAGRVTLGTNFQDEYTALKGLKEKGITVTNLTREERAAFVDKMKPVHEKWKMIIGADLYNEAKKAAEKR